MGFHASVEAQTPSGNGSVDVLLSKGDFTVGIEVSVTTPVDHELGNLRKCLDSQFNLVVMVSPDAGHLTKIRSAALEAFTGDEQDRLRFFVPEKLVDFFEELDAAAQSKVSTVRGYTVRTKYSRLSKGEREARREVIAKILASRGGA